MVIIISMRVMALMRLVQYLIMIHSGHVLMGECGYKYLCGIYLVDNTYHATIRHV